MKPDRLLVLLLVAAVAALGGTTAWAVAKTAGSTATSNVYGSMMDGSSGMMGSGSTTGSGGMMGYASAAGGARVESPGEAKRLAQRFADRLGLTVDEVLQFERNYYVKLVDKNGTGATEVVVDPPTGTVSLEYGPAMMWNTRYGMHSGVAARMMGSYGAEMMGGGSDEMMGGGSDGMMGGSSSAATGPQVTIDRARQVAQRWLDANRAGLKVESGGDVFPGYYTFEVLKQRTIDGMMSVNATTGAVVYHWWHGGFVAELK